MVAACEPHGPAHAKLPHVPSGAHLKGRMLPELAPLLGVLKGDDVHRARRRCARARPVVRSLPPATTTLPSTALDDSPPRVGDESEESDERERGERAGPHSKVTLNRAFFPFCCLGSSSDSSSENLRRRWRERAHKTEGLSGLDGRCRRCQRTRGCRCVRARSVVVRGHPGPRLADRPKVRGGGAAIIVLAVRECAFRLTAGGAGPSLLSRGSRERAPRCSRRSHRLLRTSVPCDVYVSLCVGV